ncbi:MAG: ATP-binding protein [Treponema sp.]|nr:ATP-binding protein [Treponema sp.]MBR4629634.1 ATP-binding protein [Treponema sp.]
MQITRNLYLEKLINRRKNGLIKIVTGMRRSGKSYLLNTIFYNYLLQNGIPKDHIVQIAFDDIQNKPLRTAEALYSHIKQLISDEKEYILLLDEIQFVKEFEDALNGFLHIQNIDVYVTGSNSKFLSSDIITEFRGRGDEIRMHTLSFSEYTSAHSGTKDEAWDDFMNYGGLPYTLYLQEAEEKEAYLKNLFSQVYMSDIIERHRVKNETELEEILDFLSSSVGSLTNPLKLSNTFKSVKHKVISDHTIKNYINYFEDAFIINKAKRYDIKGKKYINSSAKYYFSDIGLRNARLNFRQTEESHLMENIIYNELLIRGYSVDVGVVEVFGKSTEGKTTKSQLEIDFIATKGSKKLYVQSALNLSTEDKMNQEMRSFKNVSDNFRKIIVVRDNIKLRRNEIGIETIGIMNFLLNEDIL